MSITHLDIDTSILLSPKVLISIDIYFFPGALCCVLRSGSVSVSGSAVVADMVAEVLISHFLYKIEKGLWQRYLFSCAF